MAGWGAIAGGLVDGVIGGFTKKKQYEKQKLMYKRRYRWTMKDMQKAGLNPILAAGGGFSVGSPSAGDLSVDTNFSEAIPQAIRMNLELKQAKAAIDKMEQDRATSEAQAHQATSAQNLNDEMARGQVIANQRNDLDLRIAAQTAAEQKDAEIGAVKARAAADQAAADTAGYTLPGGVRIPRQLFDKLKHKVQDKGVLDAVLEIWNEWGTGASSAKGMTRGEGD